MYLCYPAERAKCRCIFPAQQVCLLVDTVPTSELKQAAVNGSISSAKAVHTAAVGQMKAIAPANEDPCEHSKVQARYSRSPCGPVQHCTAACLDTPRKLFCIRPSIRALQGAAEPDRNLHMTRMTN